MSSITPNPSASQQSNVTNWKEIDLSTPEGLRELDKHISMRLGYTIETDQVAPKTVIHYLCINGKRSQSSYGIDISVVWKTFAPRFTADVNTALKLVDYTKASFRLDSNAPGWWRAWFSPMGTMKNADTPALAICLAWLDWQDANGGQS